MFQRIPVSIPSSSGHQFTERAAPTSPIRSWYGFQSLLHQGISLLRSSRASKAQALRLFQSLLHQGISLLLPQLEALTGRLPQFQSLLHQGISLLLTVSNSANILGLSFNPFFIRASVYWLSMDMGYPNALIWFQSLLHQGISLLGEEYFNYMIDAGYGFNPFFIRASVYWARAPVRPAIAWHSFNPFFIRASVYWIPPGAGTGAGTPGFNPFFIRASVYWDRDMADTPQTAGPFQSLLHQGISLLKLQIVSRYQLPLVKFQSLLHQGISLLNRAESYENVGIGIGFNPFFIRASVYCQKVAL